jgi:hypothetical protein
MECAVRGNGIVQVIRVAGSCKYSKNSDELEELKTPRMRKGEVPTSGFLPFA